MKSYLVRVYEYPTKSVERLADEYSRWGKSEYVSVEDLSGEPIKLYEQRLIDLDIEGLVRLLNGEKRG